MVVAPSGVVYVNTWSGEYYGNDTPHAGGFLVALQGKAGAGKADVNERFGETVQSGGAGGTGIGLYKGSIFAEINDRIVRYPLAAGFIVSKDAPVTIVSGLPLGGDHPMHPFIINAQGIMYVDVASATNSCQLKIARSNRRGRIRALSLRRGEASGNTTPTRRTKHSRRPNGTQPESATGKALRLTPTAGCL